MLFYLSEKKICLDQAIVFKLR